MLRTLRHSSRTGENVLDLFGESGSTLIAAQRTGRRTFLMKLDTLYCDVIVQRWEQYTGLKAEREFRRRQSPSNVKHEARLTGSARSMQDKC